MYSPLKQKLECYKSNLVYDVLTFFFKKAVQFQIKSQSLIQQYREA